MNAYILKVGFLIHLIGFVLYSANYSGSGIHFLTTLIGLSVYIIYTYLYRLSLIDIHFIKFITPTNYSDIHYGSHKIIAYSFSTIHALFIALCATLYVLNIIGNYSIKQFFFISMSYYFADLYYDISSTTKLTKLNYFAFCHHIIMIIIYYIIFFQINNDINLENSLLKYMNRGLMSEYSVPILNYSWYLINTKQDKTVKMLISSVLTLILYFITRVVNFTVILYNFWRDDLLLVIAIMLPLFLINYFWFYKLTCKAYSIYIRFTHLDSKKLKI